MKVTLCSSLFIISLLSICPAEADQDPVNTASASVKQSTNVKQTGSIGSQMSADLIDIKYMFKQPYCTNSSEDTVLMQNKVLEKINQALIRGAITPQEASDLKARLNTIGGRESWYKSAGIPVPAGLIKENIKKLSALDNAINNQLPVESTGAANRSTLQFDDVRQLIGQALAKNKVTNSQAEQYYSRLTEIENDTESLKNDPVGSNSELANLHERLHLLKADIQCKLK